MLQSDVAQLATLTECSNELSAHLHYNIPVPFDTNCHSLVAILAHHIDIDCGFEFSCCHG